MFKKFLLIFSFVFISLCTFAGQEDVYLEVLGKDKGTIGFMRQDGQDFVYALKLAKILKFQTSWFARSGQLNLKGKDGFFAILREGKSEAMINGTASPIAACAFMQEGDLYVPLSFFTQGGQAAPYGKYPAIFKDGKIIIGPKALEAPLDQETASNILRPSVLEDAQPGTAQEEPTILGDDFFAEQEAGEQKQALSLPANEANIKDTHGSVRASKTVVNKLPLTTPDRFAKKAPKKRGKIRVFIDPGHGGKDPGAARKGSSKEKEINLNVSKELYKILGKESGFEVKISRDDDTFIPLSDRAKMANNYQADLFVSIHSNAAKRTSANGFEVYFRSDKASDAEAAETAALENEALQYESGTGHISFADLLLKSLATNETINESSKLAGHIRNFTAKKSSSIGVKVYEKSSIKQANFYVLQGVNAPSILVEMGYLSNRNDKKKLNTRSVQSKIAQSIKEGIISYCKAEGWK